MDLLAMPTSVSRPIMLTNDVEIDLLRGKLQRPEYKRLYEAVLRLAQSDPADVTSPQATAADVDPHHFSVGWQLLGLESVLPAAGVMWLISGDRSYLSRAVKLMGQALSWERWSDGRHLVVDGYYNAAPETASGIRAFAWGLDLFSGSLPSALELSCRKQVAFLAQRLMEISIEGSTRWSANLFDDWSADIHSAIGHSGLALYGVDERASDWVAYALTRVLAYLDCLPDDGGHPSGISRWEFALTRCCFFLESLFRVTGQDFRLHPAVERTRRFAVRCLAPGGRDIVQIDQGMPLYVSNVAQSALSKLLARWFHDPVIAWAISHAGEQTHVEAHDLLWMDDSLAETPPDATQEASAAFPDIGWAVMRSGWTAEDNMIAFQCTPYWPGYHHLDQGTFEIFVRGREMALDSGLGWRAHPNYFERYRDSQAHNVVLVDGKGQLRHSRESCGEMRTIRMSEFADYAVGECAGAYETLSRFTRSVLFLKPDIVVIHDAIESESPRSIEWLLHGAGKFEVHVRADDRGFTIQDEGSGIEGFVLQPARWKYTLHRGYKLAEWQTRHEVTHPVLVVIPQKSDAVEFLVILKLGEADQERVFPGDVCSDGSLILRTDGRAWKVETSNDGLTYSMLE